jgi:hypothetical protein
MCVCVGGGGVGELNSVPLLCLPTTAYRIISTKFYARVFHLNR